MARYIAKRLLALIPVILIVAVVVFMLVQLTPGDPASILLGDESDAATIAQLNAELGMDLPLREQFLNWFSNVLKGNLGSSIFFKKPVTEMFWTNFRPTLALAIYAEVIAIVLALVFGSLAAKFRGTWLDHVVSGFTVLGISVPSFLWALILVMVFAVYFRLFPSSGYKDLSNGFLPFIRYLTLPAFALGLVQSSIMTRITRVNMIEALESPYIKAAAARGISTSKLVFKHALKNSFLPILTVIGDSFGGLITGAAVVETVFNIPGIGQLIINSIERRDYIVIQGSIILITFIYLTLNLVIDILYGVVDPRVRLESEAS